MRAILSSRIESRLNRAAPGGPRGSAGAVVVAVMPRRYPLRGPPAERPTRAPAKPVVEPKRGEGPHRGEAGPMNGIVEVGTALSLVLDGALLAAGGLALPFISPERKDHR